MYLHLYYNPQRTVDDQLSFHKLLDQLEAELLSGKRTKAHEKLDEKVNSLKYISNKENINSEDDFTKKIGIMSKEKLKADNGDKYEDIIFYQVFNYRINNIISSFLITAIIIIIFSNIYTDEKLSNVDSVILSSQNKNKVLYSKLVLSIMVPILVYLLYIVIIGFITAIQYGSPINGNLQAYRISDIPFMLKNSININEYTIINIFTMMIIFTTISVFSSLASFVGNNSVGAVVGSTVIIVLGKILTLIKFLPKSILLVLSSSNYIDIFQYPQEFIGIYKGSINILGRSIDIMVLNYGYLIGMLIISILATIYVFKRVLDMNDRALRDIVVGMGGTANGFLREDGFTITVASEVMAILCLSKDLMDLKERFGKILVAYNLDGNPVFCKDLNVQGSMATLMKDAIKPNLVQTLDNTPAIIHGGPFANIAHGCNSILATKMALKLGDYTVTEAGFGADLGAEKFFDIKCRFAGLKPSCAVIVATIRAIKHHGGVKKDGLNTPNVDALTKGIVNLEKQIENVQKYGVPVVVAINKFVSDSDEEIKFIEDFCQFEFILFNLFILFTCNPSIGFPR